MRTLFLCLLVLILLPIHPVLSQNRPDPSQYDIAKCQNLDEVEAAKKAGREFIEIRGSYLFKHGDTYKGLYPSLRRAIEERKKLSGSTGQKNPSMQNLSQHGAAFNPLTIIYPFTQIDAEKQTVFEVPDGNLVAASKVMLHAQPYSFDSVSFGLVRIPQQGIHFAVTGEFFAEPTVKEATGHLEYYTGAAVVSTEGEVLWKHYGKVEKDQGFMSMNPVGKPQGTPEFLLLFLLAKGKLSKQLAFTEPFSEVDAKGYDYHVLSSMALEVGPNWFPPLEEVTKEEYLKLYREKQQEVSDHFKEFKPPEKP